jgi:hypothetical protein
MSIRSPRVRGLTSFTRVMIYRFLEDDSRCVIAEDKDAGFAVASPVSFGLADNSASRVRRNTRSLALRDRTAPILPPGTKLIRQLAARRVSDEPICHRVVGKYSRG